MQSQSTFNTRFYWDPTYGRIKFNCLPISLSLSLSISPSLHLSPSLCFPSFLGYKGRKYTKWQKSDEKELLAHFKPYIYGEATKKLPGMLPYLILVHLCIFAKKCKVLRERVNDISKNSVVYFSFNLNVYLCYIRWQINFSS